MNVAELELQHYLREHGYSMTRPRYVVFEVLENKEAMTMAELVENCQGRLDRATVYRTVTLFEELDIIVRVQIGWKYRLELSDRFSHHHHHLTCNTCGRVLSLTEDVELESRLHALAQLYHFKPSDHQIEIRGLCRNCQQHAVTA